MTVLLFFITLINIMTPQHTVIANDNGTNVFSILKAIEQISKHKEVIILTKKVTSVSNETIRKHEETDYESLESETGNDNDFEDIQGKYEQNGVQYSKMGSVLRWLPKKRRDPAKDAKRLAEKREAAIKLSGQKAKAINDEKANYVIDLIKNNYFTAMYFYAEVRRIREKKVVLDDLRRLALLLDIEINENLKNEILQCYKKGRVTAPPSVWDNKMNNLVINILKNPDNDNVRN